MARRSLLRFTQATFTGFETNWHHVAVCDALDRLIAGRIRRLLLLMPPRHSKSEMVSRRLPAYVMGTNPDARVIATSYSADLASRMNRDVQRIIDSPAYRDLFPASQLWGKNNRTIAGGSYLRNSDIFEIVGASGVYRSAGIGGGITGMGFDIGIIDDPIKNRQEANSKVYRDNLWDWFTSVFFTRQEKDARILVTMTSWHPDDLAGRLIALSRGAPPEEQWTVLRFPALAEGDEGDPRAEGEALWPGKYDEAALDGIRRTLGRYEWAALYQCRPQPRSGGLFRWEDIDGGRAASHPDLTRIVVAVDPSGSATGDAVGIVVAGLGRDHHAYILADRTLNATPAQWARAVIAAYHEHRADRVVAERNFGGDMVESILRSTDPRVSYEGVTATRGKTLRAEPVAALYEQRLVHHVGEFGALEDEMMNWQPGDSSPNRMDALVWAITALMLDTQDEVSVLYDESVRVSIGDY